MTFKDLKRSINVSSNQQQTHFFDKLHNKPFWIWDIEEHKLEDVRTKGKCCFNHIIGLPTKEGLDLSISGVDLLQMLHQLLPVYKSDLPFVDLVMYTTPCRFQHQQ